LIGIASCDESNKDVRVNREHAVVEYAFGWPASRRGSAWHSACL
jgi:hypothetical protein